MELTRSKYNMPVQLECVLLTEILVKIDSLR